MKLLRHDRRAEAYRRDIKSQLRDEGNHEAKITIFDIERGNIEPRSQCCKKGKKQEKRQGQYVPVRNVLIPDHQPNQNHKRDEEIHSCHDHRRCGDNESWEIDF